MTLKTLMQIRECIKSKFTLRIMSTLTEIETAAESLSSEEKKELLRFLAMRLRQDRTVIEQRIDSNEAQTTMLPDDEGPSEQRRQGKASEWLRTAKGSVHVTAGESAEDVRMAYYATKYGLTP